jgi:fluoride exporter
VIAVLAFAACATVGALARLVLSTPLNARWGFPWGTLLVNVSGSAALGAAASADAVVLTAVGVGAVSTYTTFSTFAVEVDILARRSLAAAGAYAVATVVCCSVAAWTTLVLVG